MRLTCFLSQQAAEMAVKALCERKRIEHWGHVVSKILSDLAEIMVISDDIMDKAKALDRFYIPTRYPNSFERGAPMEYYTERDAAEAIRYAEEIIQFCKKHIPG